MRVRTRKTAGAAAYVVAACLLLAACGRGDAPAAEADDGGSAALADEGVQVEMDRPDSLAWGLESALQLRVANRGRDTLTGARLRVQLPAGVEAVAPPGVAVDGGTVTELAVAPLPPGQAQEFTMRIRLPASAPADTAVAARRFVVRAQTVTPQGAEIGGAAVDTLEVPGPVRAALGCGAGGRLPLTRYGVGAVRLGMTRAEIEALCPGVRDTTWTGQEGMRERGVAVPVGADTLLAVLAGDTVARFRVTDADLRTAAGLGVGSTLGDLRTRMGRTCAGVGEGRAAVWFPNAPGISFALSAQPPQPWSRVERDPALLPDTATVTELWVRHGVDDCPAPADTTNPEDAR